MKKNKPNPQSTRLTKDNKKRFYSLMLNLLGYIGDRYSAEYLSNVVKDGYENINPSYWELHRKFNKWGAKWMLDQKRKDIIFLLTLDKLNSLSQYHRSFHYSKNSKISMIIKKWGSFETMAKEVKKKLKKYNYPRVHYSLADYLEDKAENYLDYQHLLSAENLYRIAITGSISYACNLTLNKYINLVVTKSKGLALKNAIECTQITSASKYKSLMFNRAKDTGDSRLFRLLSKKLSYEKKAELFLYLFDKTITKYNNKPCPLNDQASWYNSDLYPHKLYNLYYDISDSYGFKNCSDNKRKSLSIISKDLGNCLFSMDWNNNKFLLMARLPYHILYDIMFSHLSSLPKGKVKDVLNNFFSNILAKRDELFIIETLKTPTLKEKNQIYFINSFLESDNYSYSRNLSSDILRDCIALYGDHEDFLYFMSHLKSEHQKEFFKRAESKWK